MTKRIYDSIFVGGEWVAPQTSDTLSVVAPATEEVIGQTPICGAEDIDRAVAAADAARGWAQLSAAERAEIMNRFADEIDRIATDLDTQVSTEMGMPITLSRMANAVVASTLVRYYAELARNLDWEASRPGMLGTTMVRREPVGVVGIIVPWNFPVSLLFMKLPAALAAGCTTVIKPSPETVLSANMIAEAAAAAGVPAGVINVVPGGADAGEALVEHRGVQKIAFTGSTGVGRAIAARCGDLLKPVTLELGGKSAGIICDDADLFASVEQFVASTLVNTGQACYASTRVLAPRSRYAELVDAITAIVSSLQVGDPLQEATHMGPLVTGRQRERVENYIASGRASGARVTTGGSRPADLSRGWFIEPTVFADVDNSMPIAREEIFGPVLSVIPYGDIDEAVAIANDSEFGLAGTVWTSDEQRGLDIARRIQTGTFGINGYLMDLWAPFGGVKNSGLGRELGPEGMEAYLRTKSIYRTGTQQ
ncbi:aldehyde dehydrogenase [Mycolicibacterium porcinum]|uniref:Aldehyde dehydrogenase n=1 Tax=Mycolicibacterium porcinum TaxID=39693 RepID=A0AAW5STP5_9MYCO|nr:aldehyde dehydrogenase [Mycolicibacterium porcinum]MCV7386465.1 aldehyde dehydrogenase [Mycolicibacterium porcinum]ORB39039.1 aldehyde dehydrogenase [Mycolicibacterium porcinum]CDO30865.1 aldehyde dehydrogenase [Mycolicibacterium vulneris]